MGKTKISLPDSLLEFKYQLKDILLHILISLICTGLVYEIFHSVKLALVTFLVGVFIDLDHFIDYVLHFGLKFNLSNFLGSAYLKSGKLYLVLHSYELLIPLWVWGIYFNQETIAFAITFGFLVHLLTDQRLRTVPFAYFLIYRVLNGFKAEKIVPETLKKLNIPI